MKLLLAEDEPSLSRAVQVLFERNGYSVDPVFDGETALDAISNGIYDAAILDIMMPKKDGLEVLKAVRQAGNRIPVLLLTAKAEVDDKVLGLDTGANDYLTKPFSVQELLARIRAMLRTQSIDRESATLSRGNISLNRTTFEVTSSTGSFRLSNKEFQMLEMLLCIPGHPLPAECFMERIWKNETPDPALRIQHRCRSRCRRAPASLRPLLPLRPFKKFCHRRLRHRARHCESHREYPPWTDPGDHSRWESADHRGGLPG